jgi:lactate dehydrogenase-like 2-hydroxyacid dehydrogenase
MGWNVYVTRRIPDAGLQMLRERCQAVEVNPHDRVLTRQELLGAVVGRDGVLCLLTDRIDAEVLDAARGCKVFANCAVGYDNVDVPAATARGVAITNTPGVLTDATADLTWALIFAVARRVVEGDRYIRDGKFEGWAPMLFLGGDITGQTLGIVGAGRIGQAVARRSVGFQMKVLYTDPSPRPDLEREVGAKRVKFDELLREADFEAHAPSPRSQTLPAIDYPVFR